MFMHGLGDADYMPLDVSQFETPANGYDTAANSYSAPVSSMPSANGSDWTSGLISSISKILPAAAQTYQQIKLTDAQAQLQQAKAVQALQYPYGATMTANGVVVPNASFLQSGSIAGISPILLIGVAALAVYALRD